MLCYRCKKEIEGDLVEGLHKKCFEDWFQLESVKPFEDIAAQRSGNSSDAITQLNSSFFHGKFKKYSANLGGRNYILKVQQPEYPELPVTEFLCNEIARLLAIDVPNFYLIRFQNLKDTFVTQNFMSSLLASNLIHFYRYLNSTEEFDIETIIRIIEKQTNRVENVDKFIEICLFDALIGNHDRHGRNLAFIQNPKGLNLAPFYDNPSYLATEDDWFLEAHHEPRGKIFTSKCTEPRMRDYVIEFVRLGYRENIEEFINKIDFESINYAISDSFVSVKRQKAIASLMSRRFKELRDAL